MDVSIIIPVLNKLEFTRACLDRLWRNTDDGISLEVVIVDNASSDATPEWFADTARFPRPVKYLRNVQNLGYAKANNQGARLAGGDYLLFLNNDTLAEPGWLTEMLRIAARPSVGIVGIKQLFPYTNVIYHTGIAFDGGGMPQHLYPHLDASLPYVNKEREYQAVTGACLMIRRRLFDECGGFDEGYVNGYEDIDLCLTARDRGSKVVCCTKAFIYHYGQISEGRTSADDRNAERFKSRWKGRVTPDLDTFRLSDRRDTAAVRPPDTHPRLPADAIYLADDFSQGSALTWMNAELALALDTLGVPVFVNGTGLSPTLPAAVRKRLTALSCADRPAGGVQVKWSHYWPRHLDLELAGDINLEFFVINYQFLNLASEPWDYWLQSVRHSGHHKLPLSRFCQFVLGQLGVPGDAADVLWPGYSPEIVDAERPPGGDSRFRFLTVTNSHDLARYGTASLIEAYRRAFRDNDEVTLVLKDYGASSGDQTLRNLIAARPDGPRIDYVHQFTGKRELIDLYRSCDAFVSAHRGEGFGMKILDAMACGLPVIAPRFGGPADYCTPGNSFPVDYALVPMADCLDTQSLRITNQPLWAEPEVASLAARMRGVYDDRAAAAAVGAAGRESVIRDLTWQRSAARLVEIAARIEADRAALPRVRREAPSAAKEWSPYWLGLRVSVIIPTHNRRQKLLTCLDALARQSILPQELEVIVVDDGSSDGTGEALTASRFPFRLKYLRQQQAGPGTGRNLGVQHAEGELVLFIGDDIYADERLLEEHLRAHASRTDPGTAILGHIDWAKTLTPNAVMNYVCGDAMLQFAYSYIPTAAALDHRFFYTSNISLKRQFLLDAAEAGIGFDPSFRHAAFEDSELAFRLIPRGLHIHYHAAARTAHDHWVDLAGFAERESRAGEMAVVYYRKHPGQDEQLQVRWIADLVEPAAALLGNRDLLQRVEAFDRETDALLTATAASLEALLAINGQLGLGSSETLSPGRIRSSLDNVLRVIFDVQRTRGKVKEWYAGVDDPAKMRAAQSLASMLRKIEFLDLTSGPARALTHASLSDLDRQVVASLGGRPGPGDSAFAGNASRVRLMANLRSRARGTLLNPAIVSRLIRADRRIQQSLQRRDRTWLARYQRLRGQLKQLLR